MKTKYENILQNNHSWNSFKINCPQVQQQHFLQEFFKERVLPIVCKYTNETAHAYFQTDNMRIHERPNG